LECRGHSCSNVAADGIDDVGFSAAAIEDAGRSVAIDPARIQMEGFLNGESLTYRFAA
jgi:poly(3-hydroxybutyrate) depolymerase